MKKLNFILLMLMTTVFSFSKNLYAESFKRKFTQTDSHFLIETYLAGTNQPVTKNRNPGENMLFIELFESMNILR